MIVCSPTRSAAHSGTAGCGRDSIKVALSHCCAPGILGLVENWCGSSIILLFSMATELCARTPLPRAPYRSLLPTTSPLAHSHTQDWPGATLTWEFSPNPCTPAQCCTETVAAEIISPLLVCQKTTLIEDKGTAYSNKCLQDVVHS